MEIAKKPLGADTRQILRFLIAGLKNHASSRSKKRIPKTLGTNDELGQSFLETLWAGEIFPMSVQILRIHWREMVENGMMKRISRIKWRESVEWPILVEWGLLGD